MRIEIELEHKGRLSRAITQAINEVAKHEDVTYVRKENGEIVKDDQRSKEERAKDAASKAQECRVQTKIFVKHNDMGRIIGKGGRLVQGVSYFSMFLFGVTCYGGASFFEVVEAIQILHNTAGLGTSGAPPEPLKAPFLRCSFVPRTT